MAVRQAANVVELLEFFHRRLKPATMAEISDDLGWPRSSTFNLVGTLAELGYLYEPRGRGGYYPSPKWMSTLRSIVDADPLAPALLDAIQAIRDRTGETTAVSQASGIQAIFLDVCETDQPIRYLATVGTHVPIHASSAGRAILSQYSVQERAAFYRKIRFTDYSPTTPMNAEAVEAEIAEAERRGYHQSEAEYIPDLAGVAIPVMVESRKLSIVVAGPVSRCLQLRPKTAEIIRQELERHGLRGL